MAAAVRSAKKVSDDNLEKRLTFPMLNIIMHMVSPDRLLKGNKKNTLFRYRLPRSVQSVRPTHLPKA